MKNKILKAIVVGLVLNSCGGDGSGSGSSASTLKTVAYESAFVNSPDRLSSLIQKTGASTSFTASTFSTVEKKDYILFDVATTPNFTIQKGGSLISALTEVKGKGEFNLTVDAGGNFYSRNVILDAGSDNLTFKYTHTPGSSFDLGGKEGEGTTISPAFLSTQGNVTVEGIFSVSRSDIWLIKDSTLTIPQAFTNEANIVLRKGKFKPNSYTQTSKGSLVVFQEGNTWNNSLETPGTAQLAGTFYFLTDQTQITGTHEIIKASKILGSFEQVVLPDFMSLKYTDNQVSVVARETNAEIQKYRKMARLEGAVKYDVDSVVVVYDGKENLRGISEIGHLILAQDLSAASINTNLNIQVLDIIGITSGTSAREINFQEATTAEGTFNFAVLDKGLASSSEAVDGKMFILNRGNTKLTLDKDLNLLKMPKNMVLSQKDGVFEVGALINDGLIIIDGNDSQIKVDQYLQTSSGKLVIIDNGQGQGPKLDVGYADLGGEIEILTDGTTPKEFVVVKSRGDKLIPMIDTDGKLTGEDSCMVIRDFSTKKIEGDVVSGANEVTFTPSPANRTSAAYQGSIRRQKALSAAAIVASLESRDAIPVGPLGFYVNKTENFAQNFGGGMTLGALKMHASKDNPQTQTPTMAYSFGAELAPQFGPLQIHFGYAQMQTKNTNMNMEMVPYIHLQSMETTQNLLSLKGSFKFNELSFGFGHTWITEPEKSHLYMTTLSSSHDVYWGKIQIHSAYSAYLKYDFAKNQALTFTYAQVENETRWNFGIEFKG